MVSYPLTPTGAEDKLTELYALSDRELATQAMAIMIDFRAWVKTNFDLTTAQELYVDGMNADAARYFGWQCAVAFQNRIDIELIYPAPPTTPGYSKWTGSESTVKMSTDGAGNKRLTGKLTFVIDYE